MQTTSRDHFHEIYSGAFAFVPLKLTKEPSTVDRPNDHMHPYRHIWSMVHPFAV